MTAAPGPGGWSRSCSCLPVIVNQSTKIDDGVPATPWHGSLASAQTVALTTMVVFQVFHVGNSRSEHLSVLAKSPLSNRFLFVSTAAALLVHLVALNVGPTQFVLRVEPILDAGTWLRIVAVAATILAAIEVHKLLRRGARRPREVFGGRPRAAAPGPAAGSFTRSPQPLSKGSSD